MYVGIVADVTTSSHTTTDTYYSTPRDLYVSLDAGDVAMTTAVPVASWQQKQQQQHVGVTMETSLNSVQQQAKFKVTKHEPTSSAKANE